MNRRHLEEKRAVGYYEDKLAQHGSTAAGVDWGSEESQELRFEQLLRVVDPARRDVKLNDFGCGYGALAVRALQLPGVSSYVGFDLSEAMIEAARSSHAESHGAAFVNRLEDLGVADYTVASGVFNVRQESSEEVWWDYVQDLIADLARFSRHGFAFNVLTSFADEDRKVSRLFYADPSQVLRHCQETYSRWVTLLHDYGLYEFTVLVRAESEGAWQI
ncbi:MAG: class I SAM-dependent methyltransferase [Acidobacteriota bacterium]